MPAVITSAHIATRFVMKALFLSLLLGSALLLAHGADAFTLDTRTPVNPDGSAKFVDPDQQVENLTSPSTSTSTPGVKSFRSGNMTFSFGLNREDERPAFGRVSPFNNFGFARNLHGFDHN
jgi:hypothetical protein